MLTVDVNTSLDCEIDFFIAPKFFVILVLSVVAIVFEVEFAMVLGSAIVVSEVCGESLGLGKLKICASVYKGLFCEPRVFCVVICVVVG